MYEVKIISIDRDRRDIVVELPDKKRHMIPGVGAKNKEELKSYLRGFLIANMEKAQEPFLPDVKEGEILKIEKQISPLVTPIIGEIKDAPV